MTAPLPGPRTTPPRRHGAARTPALAALLAIGVLVLAGLLAWRAFTSGAFGFDDWVARKLADIAEVYIVPDLAFDSFDYADRAVTLNAVTLTAPDGTRVASIDALRVVLSDIPKRGEPLVIREVELTGPTLRLLQTDDGGFRGLVPFAESRAIDNQQDLEPDVQAKNILEIRRIVLTGAAIRFEPADGDPPMVLDDLHLELDVQPDQNNPKLYELAFEFDRAPNLTLATTGRLDLAARAYSTDNTTLEADLDDPDAVAALPPSLQSLIEKHQARGRLRVIASGDIPFRDTLAAANAQTRIQLDAFDIGFGEYRVPVPQARIHANLSSGVLTLPTAEIDVAEGTVTLTDASADLTDPDRPVRAAWDVAGVELRDFLRITRSDPDATPRFAGVVTSAGSAKARADDLPASLTGSGSLEIRDGRLVKIPVVSDIAAALDVLSKLSDNPTYRDRADARFDLTADAVVLDKLTLETALVAARGSGRINYDRTIDLSLNAGPLEKLEEKTGPIGAVFGAITDALVKYHVTGPISDPKLRVRPLNIGG